jgi:hypothetical protein
LFWRGYFCGERLKLDLYMPTTPAFQPAFLMLVMLKAAFIYARDTPYHIFKVIISHFVLYKMILASKKKKKRGKKK